MKTNARRPSKKRTRPRLWLLNPSRDTKSCPKKDMKRNRPRRLSPRHRLQLESKPFHHRKNLLTDAKFPQRRKRGGLNKPKRPRKRRKIKAKRKRAKLKKRHRLLRQRVRLSDGQIHKICKVRT